MRYERLKKSPSWSPTSSPTTSRSLDKSRPFPLQAKPHSELSPTQEDIENEAFQQHKHEATGLEVQAEYGSLTPEGQQRLTVLQAKMDDFWQKKESSQASGINLLEIPNLFAPRQPLAAQPIQPKLTMGEPGDKYEQEADQVAAQVVNQINAPQKQPSSQGGTLQRQEVLGKDKEINMKPLLQPKSSAEQISQHQSANSHVIQRYFVRPAQGYANQAHGGAVNVDFEAQEKNVVSKPSTAADPGPHPGVSTFVTAANTTNIVNSQNIPLRISNDGRMAIEDSDLGNRQPKTFFAEQAFIDQSNNDLKAVGSSYLLTGTGGQSIQIQDAHGGHHWQVQVRPIKLDQQGAPPVGAWQHPDVESNCNAVAAKIIGLAESTAKEQLNPNTTLNPPATVRNQSNGNTQSRDFNNVDLETRIAYYVEQYVTSRISGANHAAARNVANVATANVAQSTGLLPGAMTGTINTIAQNYGTHLRNNPPALAQVVQDLGINQYANPAVGQTFLTASLGRPTGPALAGPIPDWSDPINPGQMKASGGTGEIWQSHYGAVVAKSGDDIMTLQNYNRTEEDKGSGVGGARDDNRYYFQMYGPPTQNDPNTGRDQSWHTTWQHGTRGFANPITLALGAEEQYALSAKAQSVIQKGINLGVFDNAEAASIGKFLRIKASPNIQSQLVEDYRGTSNALKQKLTIGLDKGIIDSRLDAGRAAVIKHYWERAGKDLPGALQLKANLLTEGIATPNATLNLGPLLQNNGVPAATVGGLLGL